MVFCTERVLFASLSSKRLASCWGSLKSMGTKAVDFEDLGKVGAGVADLLDRCRDAQVAKGRRAAALTALHLQRAHHAQTMLAYRWRERARDLRKLADALADQASPSTLYRQAADYDRLADVALASIERKNFEVEPPR